MSRKPKGNTTGLGILNYLVYIFQANEFMEHKLTDSQIARKLAQEFPERPIPKTTINQYRIRYNQGIYAKDKKIPKIRSFRYDKDGDKVEGRFGNKKLNNLEIETTLSAHKYWYARQSLESV